MAGEKIKSLQVLRFIAAGLVVSTHAQYFATVLTIGAERASQAVPQRTGAMGVDIFFVLSGVIIYKVAFARNAVTPSQFLWGRITRIVPIFWLVNFVWVPVHIPIGGAPTATFSNVATALSFWPAWDGIDIP